ncbi:MAG: NAD-dependent dehydratase, partial [Proteobacteria bacterium]|nr:NAD-dependent dehydratase [Pseudomonadota bacterium]
EIAVLAGKRPLSFKVPHAMVLPIAYAAEGFAKYISGREPFATIDGVRMSKKKMYFSSEKAREKLGYEPRPAVEALGDAFRWFRDNGYLA